VSGEFFSMSSTRTHLPQENPFATRSVRPGALPYLFPPGEEISDLVEKLRAHDWCGEIIGPHGAGKSTLLAALIPELEAAGRRVVVGRLGVGEHRVPREILSARPWSSSTQIVVDGYEQLGWCRQQVLRRQCRSAGSGLLVTAHAVTGLPSLAKLAPTRETIEQVVAALLAKCPGAISTAEIEQAYARHGENVRELLFELYDRYEAYRRSS
jgi:hypothetical protein